MAEQLDITTKNCTIEREGHTLIVIEHNLDLIKNGDHIIELGPEAGANGGQLLATGTPEEISQAESSATGQYLSRVLGKAAAYVLTN